MEGPKVHVFWTKVNVFWTKVFWTKTTFIYIKIKSASRTSKHAFRFER